MIAKPERPPLTRYASEALSCRIRTFGSLRDRKTPRRRFMLPTGSTRDGIVQEIIAIVLNVANGLPREQSNPLDDGLPGG